jgi:CMP-N,N'-diacetyllegionaminic acid synthase
MKILAIIPARGGSKGVPNKNIKLFFDAPLLAYTFSAAKQSRLLSKIILSSEDDLIIGVAKSIGLEVPFVRPNYLSNDYSSSIDVVKHSIEFFEEKGINFDAICLLQITSPFREKGFIDRAIEKFISTNSDALISVQKVPHEHNPHWVFEQNESGLLSISTGEKQIIKRRQELPDAYFRDGSIYITKIEAIKQGSFFGERLSFIESDNELYANIDTLDDWKKAEEKYPKILNKIVCVE